LIEKPQSTRWFSGGVAWRWGLSAAATIAALALVARTVAAAQPAAAAPGRFVPTDLPNRPIGQPKGIFPGRVVWEHDPEVARWDGNPASGGWYEDRFTDPARAAQMLSRALRLLAGAESDGEAWAKLFRHFNRTHGRGDVGYRPGEKVVVKLNLNCASRRTKPEDGLYNTPQLTLALFGQLVTEAGVREEDVVVYDASRWIPDSIFTAAHARFPGIRFEDCDGGEGREKAEPDPDAAIHFRDTGLPEPAEMHLPRCVAEATYLINAAVMKGHDLAGVTLCAKNHFGSVYWNDPSSQDVHRGWNPMSLHEAISVRTRAMGQYNPLVDFMGHERFGGKTLLYLVDALYAAPRQSSPPQEWLSPPFAGHWTASVLVSQDPVAIESVAVDFFRAEQTVANMVGTVDNYLHEAALAGDPPSGTRYDPEGDGKPLRSLGVHEHWNSAQDKQYSRNLGTGKGIELIAMGAGCGPSGQKEAERDSAAMCAKGPVVLTVDEKMDPPGWAVKQRQLLAIHGRIAEEFDRAFLLDDGYAALELLHGGGVQAVDDFFECMYKFPLAYALGGPEPTWRTFWKAWQGGLGQGEALGLLRNEMVTHLDWHHSGEHYEGFWLGALCAPDDPEYRRLALKYASFYDGTCPEVPNYDPRRRVIRSINCGGAGPVLHATREDWDSRGGEFWDAWLACGHDGPINLTTTCFGTVAFLLTGEPGPKRRTLEYIDAWRRRAEANGGIVPSIVHLDGSVPPAWWGGVMGWNFKPFGGLFQVSSGPKAAWANALLMTGDASYYDELRAEADVLWKHRFLNEAGLVDLPRYRGEDGWYGELGNGIEGGGRNCAGVYSSLLANLYLATMADEDLRRILERPIQGPAGHATWHEGGYEPDWIRFLIGKNPGWPERALDEALRRGESDLAALGEEPAAEQEPKKKNARQCGWCGPLVNCMTGGAMPLWHGQLLLCRFFYFDPQERRPGIPADCAALVEALTDRSATLVLVNTSPDQPRTVLVQTGAYAEHECLSVRPEGGRPVAVDGPLFAVRLAPGAGKRFTVEMKRYVNQPTLRRPWQQPCARGLRFRGKRDPSGRTLVVRQGHIGAGVPEFRTQLECPRSEPIQGRILP
jgi:hypothetical protein